MTLREFVIKEYQATVRNHPGIPKELKDALEVNERVPRFMDNLTEQLKNPAFKDYSNNQLREVVKDATCFFLSLVQRKAEEQMMSAIEKSRIEKIIADKAILDKAVDTGIIDEEVIDVLKRKGVEGTFKENETKG